MAFFEGTLNIASQLLRMSFQKLFKIRRAMKGLVLAVYNAMIVHNTSIVRNASSKMYRVAARAGGTARAKKTDAGTKKAEMKKMPTSSAKVLPVGG